MEAIYPKYAFGSVSLPLWRKNVIEFLSEHRRYRILLWEFGPTLWDYLYEVKEKPNYTSNGLKITYSIAPVIGLITFASTRRVGFTAAVTLGMILFGACITVAIDSQKRECNSQEIKDEHCLESLKLLGEMPKYWWWPWSKKIKEIEINEKEKERAIKYNDYSFISRLMHAVLTDVIEEQFCVARYGYIYNYQKLGGKMLQGLYNKCPHGVQNFWNNHAPSCLQQSNPTALEIKSNNIIRRILNVGNEPHETLEKVLSSLKFDWLLSHLDESFRSMQMGKKTNEEHEEYFKSTIKDVQKLSLIYHADKQGSKQEGDNEQKLINQVIKVLRNMHQHIVKEHQSAYGIYNIYGKLPINVLDGDKDIYGVFNVSLCNGRTNVLNELSMLSSYEDDMMLKRNLYIREAKGIVRWSQSILELLRDDNMENIRDFAREKEEVLNNRREVEHFLKAGGYVKDWTFFDAFRDKRFDFKSETRGELEIIKRMLEAKEEILNEYEADYPTRYKNSCIEPIEWLSKKCKKEKELKIIEKDIEKLEKESKKQYGMLIGKEKGTADGVFIQPILDYRNIVRMYNKFILEMIYKRYKLKYVLKENGIDSDYVKEVKEGIEKYSEVELADFLNEVVKENGSNKRIKQIMSGLSDKDGSGEEIVHVTAFALKLLSQKLNYKFQEIETSFDRQERAYAELAKLKQGKEKAEQRAEQNAQRAQENEQRAEVTKLFGRLLRRSKLDDELCEVIEASEDTIVKAIVKQVMKNNDSPNQLLQGIMQEIRWKRDQIVNEGVVSDEIIENSIKINSMQSACTSMSNLNVSQLGMSMGR